MKTYILFLYLPINVIEYQKIDELKLVYIYKTTFTGFMICMNVSLSLNFHIKYLIEIEVTYFLSLN